MTTVDRKMAKRPPPIIFEESPALFDRESPKQFSSFYKTTRRFFLDRRNTGTARAAILEQSRNKRRCRKELFLFPAKKQYIKKSRLVRWVLPQDIHPMLHDPTPIPTPSFSSVAATPPVPQKRAAGDAIASSSVILNRIPTLFSYSVQYITRGGEQGGFF